MPGREACQDQTNYARDDSQEYDIDRRKIFQVLILLENFGPYPPGTTTEANPTE
jgi:hypothetical protein